MSSRRRYWQTSPSGVIPQGDSPREHGASKAKQGCHDDELHDTDGVGDAAELVTENKVPAAAGQSRQAIESLPKSPDSMMKPRLLPVIGAVATISLLQQLVLLKPGIGRMIHENKNTRSD